MSFAENKKAWHDYEIIENFEAGIALEGHEVKAVKTGPITLHLRFIHLSSPFWLTTVKKYNNTNLNISEAGEYFRSALLYF